MNKDFDLYYQEYLKKYNTESQISKTEDFDEEKNNARFLSLIPFVFILIFSLIINVDTNYDSKEINLMYSEKYINETPLINPKQLVKNEINNHFFNSISLDRKKEKVIAKQFENIDNFKLDVFSDSRINNTKLKVNNKLALTDWKEGFSKKKIEFIETLLPLINYQNQQILIERKSLIKIEEYLKANKTLKKTDIFYLKKLANKYKIKSKHKHKIDLVNELLQSVDIIPNSIVLAQAANESGWGTSRFAKEFNALFGQYTYDENNGVVPNNRDEGKKHLIRYFPSIDKSVESYFHNINSHYAYDEFRKIRSQMNRDNFNIKLLTKTLDVYAEDKSYVDTLNLIIDTNRFTQFDYADNIFTSS